MKGGEILDFIYKEKDLKLCFEGLYKYARLPRLKRNTFVIAYKDNSHWVVYCKFEELELFNSLGSSKREVERALPGQKVVFNKSRVQAENSSLCGQFCLFYCAIRIHNIDVHMEELLNLFFSANLQQNDDIVKRFYSSGDMEIC